MNVVFLMLLKTAIIIPIKKFEYSKTRLGTLLNPGERKELAEMLVYDTLERVSGLDQKQVIVVSGEQIKPLDEFKDIVTIDENNHAGVNNAVELANRFIENGEFSESLIVPIDLPLLSTKDLDDVIKNSRKFKKGICIVPSKRFDGTNILLRKPNLVIDTFYDNNSFYNHIKNAIRNGITVEVCHNENLMIDLDTSEDIITIMDRCNTVFDTNKPGEGERESKTILFLKEKMKNRRINV
jgi:2-phospho-L-lactate guanylyltransferase